MNTIVTSPLKSKENKMIEDKNHKENVYHEGTQFRHRHDRHGRKGDEFKAVNQKKKLNGRGMKTLKQCLHKNRMNDLLKSLYHQSSPISSSEKKLPPTSSVLQTALVTIEELPLEIEELKESKNRLRHNQVSLLKKLVALLKEHPPTGEFHEQSNLATTKVLSPLASPSSSTFTFCGFHSPKPTPAEVANPVSLEKLFEDDLPPSPERRSPHRSVPLSDSALDEISRMRFVFKPLLPSFLAPSSPQGGRGGGAGGPVLREAQKVSSMRNGLLLGEKRILKGVSLRKVMLPLPSPPPPSSLPTSPSPEEKEAMRERASTPTTLNKLTIRRLTSATRGLKESELRLLHARLQVRSPNAKSTRSSLAPPARDKGAFPPAIRGSGAPSRVLAGAKGRLTLKARRGPKPATLKRMSVGKGHQGKRGAKESISSFVGKEQSLPKTLSVGRNDTGSKSGASAVRRKLGASTVKSKPVGTRVRNKRGATSRIEVGDTGSLRNLDATDIRSQEDATDIRSQEDETDIRSQEDATGIRSQEDETDIRSQEDATGIRSQEDATAAKSIQSATSSEQETGPALSKAPRSQKMGLKRKLKGTSTGRKGRPPRSGFRPSPKSRSTPGPNSRSRLNPRPNRGPNSRSSSNPNPNPDPNPRPAPATRSQPQPRKGIRVPAVSLALNQAISQASSPPSSVPLRQSQPSHDSPPHPQPLAPPAGERPMYYYPVHPFISYDLPVHFIPMDPATIPDYLPLYLPEGTDTPTPQVYPSFVQARSVEPGVPKPRYAFANSIFSRNVPRRTLQESDILPRVLPGLASSAPNPLQFGTGSEKEGQSHPAPPRRTGSPIIGANRRTTRSPAKPVKTPPAKKDARKAPLVVLLSPPPFRQMRQKELRCVQCNFVTQKLGVMKRHELAHTREPDSPPDSSEDIMILDSSPIPASIPHSTPPSVPASIPPSVCSSVQITQTLAPTTSHQIIRLGSKLPPTAPSPPSSAPMEFNSGIKIVSTESLKSRFDPPPPLADASVGPLQKRFPSVTITPLLQH